MRKTILSAAVILLLLLNIGPAAFADVTYPDPAPLEVGQTLNHLAASVEPGSSVTVSAGSLPPGVDLVLDDNEDTTDVYLRGVPTVPGYYDAVLDVNAQNSFMCSVDVEPAQPQLIVGPSVSCSLNDVVHVSVTASVSDGGQLSYQWYTSDGSSQSSLIAGADEPIYQPGTDYVGTTYYYCVVTNHNNGLEVSVVSPSILVTVSEMSAASLSVVSLPYKTTYNVGDTLDTNGLQLQLVYTSGSTELVTSGYQIFPTLLDNAGTQTVELSYAGQTCSFQVTVQEAQERIDGIGVLTLPYRTAYTVGEVLDPTGLSVRAYIGTGYRDVSEGLECSPMLLMQEGTQTITVTYEGNVCTFTVTVESEEVPSYLSLNRLPTKTSYTVGDTLDTSGLVLYLISTKNNAMEVTEGYGVSPTKLDREGQQEITVTYGGLSCSFKVNVSAVAPSPSPSPSPSPAASPDPSASPVPSAAPSSEPTGFPAPPTRAPQPSRSVGSGKSFVGVIVGTSVIALVIIAAYVYIMNRGGFDALEDKLESLFRKGGRHKK